MATIAATGPHPHVADLMSPGNGPEGFAIAPNGKWAVAPLLLGSGAKPTAFNLTKNGQAVLMSVGPDGHLSVTGRAKLGALPEGVAFSPNSEYVYIGQLHRPEPADIPDRERQADRRGDDETARATGLDAWAGAVAAHGITGRHYRP